MANNSNVKVRRGNKLQLSGSSVEITGSTKVVGEVSASAFIGDGSGLTALNLSGSAVTAITAGTGISSSASTGAVTLAVDFSVVAALTGSAFTGPITTTSTVSGTAAQFTNLTASSFVGDLVGTASNADLLDGLNSSDFVQVANIGSVAVTSITPGNGLSGSSALSGAVTLDVVAGDGITTAGDSVAVDSTVVRTSGDQTIGGVKSFTSPLTGTYAYFSQDVFINGTASIGQLNTLNQTSLVVGDKYITILSGAVDHTTLDGSGFLWGSGSTGPTVDELGANAHVRYRNSLDALEIFPGLYVSGNASVSGSLTVTGSTILQTVSGTTAQFSALTASAALFDGAISGTTAQFTTVTASNMSISGSVLIYGTASLASNPDAAYIRYDSGSDKLVAFPGLVVSGNIDTTGSVSASSFVGNGSLLTNIDAANISGTLAVNKGGTGQTSYTDGQLLIGNSSGNTLTKNTLGAGSNIGITNGNGTISVSLSSSLSGLTNVDTTALTGTNVLVNGSLKVSGSLARSIVTVNASYTVNSTDQVVFASVTSSGDVVVTLPSPQQVDGREIVVKRSDDATQTGIVVVSSSVFIDDSNEYELAGGYQSITLVANSGSNKWFIV